ncbi:MAG: GatB/YqeY domain-containing protein [Candidatus Kerfeldbacteria bacterium]|nr:GatB/YqeY domain-containing protein [Candidatus Kerfeldbacteria bacterium]
MEKIEHDYKQAFKAHQRVKIDVLRLLKSAIKNAEIAARHNLNDEEIIAVLTTEAKRRREALALYQQGGRADLAAKEQAELQELMYYLPTQYSDQELETVVKETIAELKARPGDFGRVMGSVMKKIKGQAEGERVSATVKTLLR